MRLPAFVTTSPRSMSYLNRTTQSLSESGFSPYALFDPPAGDPNHRGMFRHWVYVASYALDCYLLNPVLHGYPILIFQDDVVVAKGLNDAILEFYPDQWEAQFRQAKVGCLSLYCPAKYAENGQGWVDWHGSSAWGACALMFKPQALAMILTNGVVEKWKSDFGIDRFVGQALASPFGWKVKYRNPSLAQHIGDVSTRNETDRAAGWRAASNFVGEDFQVPADYFWIDK